MEASPMISFTWRWIYILLLFFLTHPQSAYTHNNNITTSSTSTISHGTSTFNTAAGSGVLSSSSIRPSTKYNDQHNNNLVPRIVPASPTMSQVEVGGAGFRLIPPPNLAGSSHRPIPKPIPVVLPQQPQVQSQVVAQKSKPLFPTTQPPRVKATAGYAGGQLWTLTPDRNPPLIVESTAPKGMVYNYVPLPMFPTHFPLFTTPVVAYTDHIQMVPQIGLPNPSSSSSDGSFTYQPSPTSGPSGSGGSSSEIHHRPSEDRNPWLRRVGRLMSQNLFGQLVQGVLRLQRRHLQQDQQQQQQKPQQEVEESVQYHRRPRTQQYHHHQYHNNHNHNNNMMDHSSSESEVVGSWAPRPTITSYSNSNTRYTSIKNKLRGSMIPHFDDDSSEVLTIIPHTHSGHWRRPEVRVRVGRPLRLQTNSWEDFGRGSSSSKSKNSKNVKNSKNLKNLKRRKDQIKEKDDDDENDKDSTSSNSYYSRFFSFGRR